MRLLVRALATTAALAVSIALVGAQSAGTLDARFGADGTALTDFFRAADELRGLAVAPDGSLVAAGPVFNPGRGFDFGVARYSADGALRALAAIDFHPGRALNDEAVAVAALADGRIVVAGHTSSGGNNYDFAVARLLPTLESDPTFGLDGRATTDFFGNFDLATGMAVQPDGRIIVVGMVEDATREQDIGLVRYTADGALDPTFGAGGRVITDLSPSSEIPFGVALQPDGKIVVVGIAFNIGENELAMIRYMPDGTLDHTFGTDGKVLLNSIVAVPHAVAIQSDGRIVVAGVVLTSGEGADFAVWRFEHDGTLDRSFGNAGRVFTDLGNWDNATALALQPDGRIVVAGYTQLIRTFASSEFAVVRYMRSGTLDRTFGANGIAVTDVPGAGDIGQAVVIQPNRGIVVGGSTDNPRNGTTDFSLARYRSDPPNRRTLVPVADAYVRGGLFAGRSFGQAPQLAAKLGVSEDNTRVSYVKFEVRDTQIERAVLRLNASLSNTTNASVTTEVHAVRDVSWDERSLTWHTRPRVDAAIGSATVRGVAPQWYEVDITAYVQAQKRAGKSLVTVALQNAAHSSAQIEVGSREAAARSPVLELTLADPAAR